MTLSTPTETCLPLDLSGKFCPQVVLDVADFVRRSPAGARVLITSTDPLSAVDIPLFAMKNGHDLEKLAPDPAELEARPLRFLLTIRR